MGRSFHFKQKMARCLRLIQAARLLHKALLRFEISSLSKLGNLNSQYFKF